MNKKNVVINYNNELGNYLYSICDINDIENWIESFETYADALRYCNNNNYNVVKFIKDKK